jgi:hypothetical protein
MSTVVVRLPCGLAVRTSKVVLTNCMLSPDMAKLSSQKIVREADHRWRSPLCSNEDVPRPCDWGWVPFYSFLLIVLIPSTSTSSASRHPQKDIATSESRSISNDFRLMTCRTENICLSLHPHEGKICVIFSL